MFIITALRTRPRVLISPQYVHKHAGTNGGSSVLIDDLFSELGIAVISSLPAQATTRLTNLHPPPPITVSTELQDVVVSTELQVMVVSIISAPLEQRY